MSRCWHSLLLLLLLSATLAAGQQSTARPQHPPRNPARETALPTSDNEQRTERYLDSIRKQPLLLLDFVQQLPKGADLHNHL
ncbi:MAG: hypothetical protein ACXVZI_03910, partial [Terriglobales bacterium]